MTAQIQRQEGFMPLFVEFRDGHSSMELLSGTPGSLGPVLGPFIAVRLLRDELRVTTTTKEFPLARFADWTYYKGQFFSDIEIVPEEQIGPGRARRKEVFNPLLTDPVAANAL